MQQALYNTYGRLMLAVCRRYIPDPMQAEDVFQEAFVKAFNSINEFRGGSLEGWLKRIFVSHSINYYNRVLKKNLTEPITDNFSRESEWPDALDTLSAAEIMEHVNTLPQGCRLVFIMHVIEGYEHNEIAELMNITAGTSKSQLNRAKLLLRARLKHAAYK